MGERIFVELPFRSTLCEGHYRIVAYRTVEPCVSRERSTAGMEPRTRDEGAIGIAIRFVYHLH